MARLGATVPPFPQPFRGGAKGLGAGGEATKDWVTTAVSEVV